MSSVPGTTREVAPKSHSTRWIETPGGIATIIFACVGAAIVLFVSYLAHSTPQAPSQFFPISQNSSSDASALPIPLAKLPSQKIATGNVANGAKLFAANCESCHGVGGKNAQVGPTLAGMGLKAGQVAYMVRHPAAVDKESAMPALTLTDNELADVSAFVASPNTQVSETTQSEPTPTPNQCDEADKLEIQSASALGNESYQKSFDLAVKGLIINESCGNADDSLINKGYFLSMKGLAEHHLSGGDSRTDLNQANQLLVECQTRPGLYGTHVAAQCESQETNNITAQTNWDIYGQ